MPVSRLSDPDHYQHTQRRTYRRGDLVTVTPIESDHWLLHMQRQVTIASEERPGGYLVRLDSATPDAAIQGPIPGARLAPGWIEADGKVRFDVRGRRP
jgi:hypothetical protein